MLNYGIVSTVSRHITPPTAKVVKECISYRLEFDGYNAWLFYEQIGFRLTRKQEKQNNLTESVREYWNDCVELEQDRLHKYIKGLNTPDLKRHNRVTYKTLMRLLVKKEDKYIRKIVEDNYYYDEIVSIEIGMANVYDFVIPDTHSFFSNGFISHNTPNGKNHAYDLWTIATENNEWFSEKLNVEDTKVLTVKQIEEERKEGMTEEMIQQEYYVSWDIGALGSYYPSYINSAKDEGRISSVPYEPNIAVDVWFDLGRNDSTVMIFEQRVGKEIRIIDCYENSGEGIQHYLEVLDSKPYRIGTLHLPHDATMKRLESQKTVEDQFREGGFRTDIVEKIKIGAGELNGIQQVRRIFPRLWFDKEKTKQLVRALENYHKEWDEKKQVFKNYPVHDWSSHAADALRYLAVGFREKHPPRKILTQFDRFDPL